MQLQWKGEQQEGRVGKPLEPFEVYVKDADGLPAQLVPVEFRIVEGAGEFSYKDERTDLGGNVIAEFIPSSDGWYRVECYVGEGDDRKVVPFKGNVKPDRRKRAGSGTMHGITDTWQMPEGRAATVIPSAAVPPPSEEQAQPPAPPPVPIVQVTVTVQPEAAPVVVTEVAQAPLAPPPAAKPAAKAAPAATAPRKAAPAPKPAPRPTVAQAVRLVRMQPVAAIAIVRQPAPQPVAAPRIAAAKPRRKARPPALPTSLLIAVVVLYALLVGLLGVLAVQTSSPPRTAAIECSGDAWVVTGNIITYRRCMATLR